MHTVDRDWFRRAFCHAGLSQRQVAEQMGVAPARLSLLLSNQGTLRATEACSLAAILQIPITTILHHLGVTAALPFYALDSAGMLHPPQPDTAMEGQPLLIYCETAESLSTHLRNINGWRLQCEPFRAVTPAANGQFGVFQMADPTQIAIGILEPVADREHRICGPLPAHGLALQVARIVTLQA